MNERLSDNRDRCGHVGDYENDYKMKQFNYRERGATGMEGDARIKQIFCELEMWIEDIVGAKQIYDKEI